MSLETATLAAGCFWGVEEAYRTLSGVVTTEVGYTGGHTDGPTYKDVCTDKTGHAEALKIEFDPEVISYRDIIKTFFTTHDATQMNRQGPDIGSQYRSAIFFHNADQEKEAREVFIEAEQASGKKFVTEITAATMWYPAEEYHQKYFQKNGGGVCHI